MLAMFSILPFGYYVGYRQYTGGEKPQAIRFWVLWSVYALVYIQDLVVVMLFNFDMIVTTDFIPLLFMILKTRVNGGGPGIKLRQPVFPILHLLTTARNPLWHRI